MATSMTISETFEPNDEDQPCPVLGCDGYLFTRYLGTREDGQIEREFACTAFSHGPLTLRRALALEAERAAVDSQRYLEEMDRRLNPVEWIIDQVVNASRRQDRSIEDIDLSNIRRPPTWPTGLWGVLPGRLYCYHGMTVLSGRASAGKTWSAVASAIEAARAGWHTYYLAAEGPDMIGSRINGYCAAQRIVKPERLSVGRVPYGLSSKQVVDWLTSRIVSQRTLVVLDSISSFQDLLESSNRRGANRWDEQTRLLRFLMQVREFTEGCVSLLILSEANARGESAGRRIDYKADLSLTFDSDADNKQIKRITVQKSWHNEYTGDIGRFMVDNFALRRIPEDYEIDDD